MVRRLPMTIADDRLGDTALNRRDDFRVTVRRLCEQSTSPFVPGKEFPA
jgi:hypothetical protein